jgi:hypothetical protein
MEVFTSLALISDGIISETVTMMYTSECNKSITPLTPF